MVRVVGTGVGDVVEYLFSTQAVPVCYAEQANRPECAFGVDIETFSFAAAHVEGELACHGEGVADLGFARSEFAKDFGHRASFDAAGQECVKLFGAGRDGDELGAALVHFCCGGEAHGDEFRGYENALSAGGRGCGSDCVSCLLLIFLSLFALIYL